MKMISFFTNSSWLLHDDFFPFNWTREEMQHKIHILYWFFQWSIAHLISTTCILCIKTAVEMYITIGGGQQFYITHCRNMSSYLL